MANKELSAHKTVRLAKGQYLFKQRDNSKELFIIKTGEVKIYKTEGGVEIELDTVGPGMVVGEVASIDGGPRTASGVATTDTEAIVIPADEFSGVLSRIPEWFRKIALILVQRLREVDDKIDRSIEGDRTGHVAAVLSLLAASDRCTPCEGGYEINLKFVENEIFDLLSLPIAEISETLDKLARRQLLKLDRNRIVLANREALDKLAEPVLKPARTEVPVT